MMDNSFEKQIRNKVGQTEVRPSEDLFDAILEKRAARSKSYLGFSYKKLFMLTAIVSVITAGVFYFMLQDDNGVTVQSSQSSAQSVQPTEPSNEGKEAVSEESSNSQVSSNDATQKESSGNSNGNSGSKALDRGNKTGSNVSASVSKARVNDAQQNNKASKGMKKIKDGFNGKPSWANADPSSYFNVDAANRPIIDVEKHQGNSHLFVYESVDPQLLENEILRYTGTSRIEKMQYPFAFDAFSPVKTSKNTYNVGNDNNKRPFFVDLLLGNVYTTVLTQDAAVNALKNGTYNQQAGIRVSVPLKGKLSVFAGLGYMNQIVHYRGDYIYNEAFTNITSKVSFINDPIRGVIRVETKDTVRGIAAKSKAVDFKNTYSLFRMPLGLGYNFGAGKFDFTLYGSADLNLLTYAKVNTMLSEANTLLKTSNAKSLHLGAGMSFMTAYRISPRFRLIAEPGVNYMHLKGASTGNFTNEKIYNFTATLGIRYSVF